MPKGDGSGPRGQGSRTGWGMGRCKPASSAAPVRQSQPVCPGMGMGMGARRGACRGFGQGSSRGIK